MRRTKKNLILFAGDFPPLTIGKLKMVGSGGMQPPGRGSGSQPGGDQVKKRSQPWWIWASHSGDREKPRKKKIVN